MGGIRLALVGLGYWGKRWLPYALTAEDFELVAVVDQSEAALAATAEAFDLPQGVCFRSLGEAYRAVQPEAVLIVVPPRFHYPVAMEAISHNLHILCEKPLAANMREAKQLLAATRGSDRIFMVDQNYRLRGPNPVVRDQIAAGAIGNVSYMVWEFQKAMRFGGWRADELEEILIEDMAIHHFDLMRYFSGRDCVEIYARSFSSSWSWYSGRPNAAAVLRFEGDLWVNYFGSWIAPGTATSLNGRVQIAGDLGAIEFDSDTGGLRIVSTQSKQVKDLPGSGVAFPGIDQALKIFGESVRTGVKPPTSIEDNIQTMAMVYTALESSRTGRPVLVEEILANS